MSPSRSRYLKETLLYIIDRQESTDEKLSLLTDIFLLTEEIRYELSEGNDGEVKKQAEILDHVQKESDEASDELCTGNEDSGGDDK